MAGGGGVPFVLDGETLRLANEEQGYRYRERQRYLQEDDRVAIIRRIDAGERQSELAREFGVTRAAICNTYKNREEILARSRHVYDAQCAAVAAGISDGREQVGGDAAGSCRGEEKLIMKKRQRSPSARGQESEMRKRSESEMGSPWRGSLANRDSPRRQQLQTDSAQRRIGREGAREPLIGSSTMDFRIRQIVSVHAGRLLNKLRDANTSTTDFRDNAGQLIRLLIENAVTVASSSITAAAKTTSKIIAIGIGDAGYPMLRNYQELFPDRAVGIFRFQQGKRHTHFVEASLPSNICSASSVLLMASEFATGQIICSAVKELVALGICESAVFLVSVFASKQGIVRVERHFPAVRGLVAAIDSHVDALGRIQPGCGGFLDRYYDVDLLSDGDPPTV